MFRRASILISLGLLLGSMPALTAQAQIDTTATDVRLRAGVAAYHAADYTAAIAWLKPVVAADPGYAHTDAGTGAYWLGRAYAAQGDGPALRATWEAGLDALETVRRFDLRLADGYLRLLGQEPDSLRAHIDEALYLYLNLLNNVDAPLLPDERALLVPHIAQLGLVLPETVRRQVMEGDLSGNPTTWAFKPGAGPRLVHWWRSQDPLPATRPNERLEEHLVRVAYAEEHYPHPDRLSRLDDRGEIYVRFGEPDKALVVKFDDPELTDLVFQPGVTVNLSDFPDNEFWRYGHIDRAAYYVFIKKSGTYQIGETTDLIPRTLRFGLGPSERGQQKAGMLLVVLRSVYQQLAMLHPDFSLRYNDVADYYREWEDNIRWGGAQRTTFEQPHYFAQNMLVRVSSEDETAAHQREIYVPQQYSEVFREVEDLPVAVRTARFLEADGTTRTEIYWGVSPGGFNLTRQTRKALRNEGIERYDGYAINLTAVQKRADYEDRVVNRNHYLVTDLPRRRGTIPAQTMVVRGDTGQYHLALQWDQLLNVGSRREGYVEGPKVKLAAEIIDSLQALSADEAVLEMSDPRPIFTEGTDDWMFAEGTGALDAPAYPFEILPKDISLALYFEVYHLAYGADDQTRFSVEYEIVRSGLRGALLQFLGTGEERTSAKTTFTGDSRTAREFVLLDMSEWEGRGHLDVTLRITDVVTGRQTERTISFEVVR